MIGPMNDYERVALMLQRLDARAVERPDLAEIASWAGLSPGHAQKLFTRWAGVSPKNYLRALQAVRAGDFLRAGQSVFDAAWESGLSGPGRLHDLLVSVEASSPGEWKGGGAGLLLRAGYTETPFGRALVAESPRGLCHLAFLIPWGEAEAWTDLESRWPAARIERHDATASSWAGRIFRPSAPAGEPSPGGLRLHLSGTRFQIAVWRALLAIPDGATTTYGDLAAAIGHPSAHRATGTAVGRNPVAWLIPCHRVIRRDGVLGQYRWGPERKAVMLAWERARAGNLSEP